MPASRGARCSTTRTLLLAFSLLAGLVLLSVQTSMTAELASRPPLVPTHEVLDARLAAASERAPVAVTPAAPSEALPQTKPGLASFPPPPASLTLVFGNDEVSDFVYNWLAHARRVPGLKPYSAVAIDDGLVAKCRAWNEPVVAVGELLAATTSAEEAPPWDSDHASRLAAALAELTCSDAQRRTLDRCNVRNQKEHFKRLGFIKISFTLRLLSHGCAAWQLAPLAHQAPRRSPLRILR